MAQTGHHRHGISSAHLYTSGAQAQRPQVAFDKN